MEDTSQELNVNSSDQPPGVGLNLSDIDILRDRIEQQKANKLKAEQLVSTLSKIKAREKASRRSIKPSEKKPEDGVNQATKRSGTNSSSALKEKSNLLKKKLEEDRAKFESKKGQDDLGKVSQIVEHIRVQLEDQDKTIQQIHSSFVTTKTQSVDEVKPTEPVIPPEVKQRINDLEMKIIDLQENLREKDSVISARTQAITLLSEDMARKGKNTLDTLEETRVQMKTMQGNFVALEDRMNEERTRLKEELEAKKLRLQQVEKNYRTAESARFELSTRMAELQEKVVAFQTKNIALEEEVVMSGSKVKELQGALENSNKQTIKMKAQFKAKLKALEEERDMLKMEAKTNDELNRLRERIADLEDEKEAGNVLKERIAEMEEKLQRQESDLDSHIKAISSLETEKLDLIEEGNRRNALLKEKEKLLEELTGQVKDIENTKVASEMKCIELEEKLHSFSKSENYIAILNSELEQAKQKLIEDQEIINDLSAKLEHQSGVIFELNQSLEGSTYSLKNEHEVSSNLAEWQTRYSALEETLNNTLHKCKEIEEKKKAVEEENNRLLKECNTLKDVVSKLEAVIQTQSDSMPDEVIVLKENIAERDLEIKNLKEHNKSLESDIVNLRYSLESTTAELHRLSQQLEQLDSTQRKIEELSAIIDSKDLALNETSNELEKRTRKLSEYKKFHKLKSEDVIRISHELETVTLSTQERINDLETALGVSRGIEEDLRKQINELKHSAEKAPDESQDSKYQEQSVKIKKLAANVKLKAKLIKDLEAKVMELENSVQNKDASVENVRDNDSNTSTVIELQEKCKFFEAEINSLRESLTLKEQELDIFRNSSTENYESLTKIKELENQNRQLNDISQNKSEQVEKMEEEISHLNGLNKSLLSDLEQMQQNFKESAVQNESVLNSFEHEVLGNKKDILELINELKEVTVKYEQTWTKLQEREGYIEELEKQLEKVKVRLLHIENTVEERRRSLEEKSEMLGARLCEAEKNNEELEKHEGELEKKINHLLNTEEMMGTILQKLQEENNELSKSLKESESNNLHFTKALENERNKVHNLTKEIYVLQSNVANYETLVEDFDKTKKELKDIHFSTETHIKQLESRLAETEQCSEAEIQRLLGKCAQVEAERQEYEERFSLLLTEKQKLEDEFCQLQQTIADVTKEEIEQLKTSHKHLAQELERELEKRQVQIYRIQELESELASQKSKLECFDVQHSEEFSTMKNKLDREIEEKEKLKLELVNERAKRQVNEVVSQAEKTFYTMTNKDEEGKFTLVNHAPSSSGLGSSHLFEENVDESKSDNYEINKLKSQVSTLSSDNQRLRLRLQELDHAISHNVVEQVNAPECDDWLAVTRDDDDGWGWGSKDAMLEHEHLQKQQVQTDLETKLLEHENKLSLVENENRKLAEELKASQTKCNKLLKKVKEFKNKSDNLERNSRERSVGFDDLDLAMQEELKTQVDKLEKNLKECNTNLNSLQVEREGFLKKIDILTSGNERLVEMKERQDIEVEMWQRRSNELQNMVQGLEWTIEELRAEQTESGIQTSSSVTEEERQQFLTSALEMEEKVNVLAAENDYLQSLLVELKDKKANDGKDASVNQPIEMNDYLHLKQENDRLSSMIQTLNDANYVNVVSLDQYYHEVGQLKKQNEDLSLEIENLKGLRMIDISQNEEHLTMCQKYDSLFSENVQLKSEISSLNEELFRFKSAVEGDVTNNTLSNIQTCKPMLDDGIEESSNSQVAANNEAPGFFRGFTSCDSDSFFEVSIGNPAGLVSLGDTQVVDQAPISEDQKNDFPDKLNLELGVKECNKKTDSQLTEGRQLSDESLEISELKTILNEKDSEISLLKANIKTCEETNNNLKKQLESPLQNSLGWNFPTDVHNNELLSESGHIWGNQLNDLNKQLQEKDIIICYLRNKLDLQPTKHSIEWQGHLSNDSLSDLFSKGENSQESYVEQITKLTRTLHDKEIEIEQLNKKKEKYKEMYHSLMKDYELQSPGKFNSDKKLLTCENQLLNQLLSDKETELEIMSQQIEQTNVAKENLQDELSLKLYEMEAVNNSYTSPQSPKDLLLPSSQPENIEDVRTLCAQISELTTLLQEKESEVEILKQQIDEVNLEKENLIDEWKKTVEEYKQKCDYATNKSDQLQKEIETLRTDTIIGAEMQYEGELQLKDQQIMNAMNDLTNTNNILRDLQAKLNNMETNLMSIQHQNECLNKELNSYKQLKESLTEITQDIEDGKYLSLEERVQLLKSNFLDAKVVLNDAESEIEEKEKTISALKEKLNELSNDQNEKTQSEPQMSSMAIKTFGSEPFRTSTEMSSSDDDSSSRQTETSHSQALLVKEIQSLKQVLSMKDSEITKMSIALNEAQENLIRGEMRLINSEETSLRQRLDEALYTLHLRDVRCNELELELMQLLEERDSLQLRLSTAIRFNEELRKESILLDNTEFKLEEKDKTLGDSDGNSQQLKLKLDQLHNVGYRRDPTLQQDQQKRHQEQMHLYTHNTSPDESQTSSGFFNWIFGASSSGSQDV